MPIIFNVDTLQEAFDVFIKTQEINTKPYSGTEESRFWMPIWVEYLNDSKPQFAVGFGVDGKIGELQEWYGDMKFIDWNDMNHLVLGRMALDPRFVIETKSGLKWHPEIIDKVCRPGDSDLPIGHGVNQAFV
jgi:hypothetical protein